MEAGFFATPNAAPVKLHCLYCQKFQHRMKSVVNFLGNETSKLRKKGK